MLAALEDWLPQYRAGGEIDRARKRLAENPAARAPNAGDRPNTVGRPNEAGHPNAAARRQVRSAAELRAEREGLNVEGH
jgi:hypothetical protein